MCVPRMFDVWFGCGKTEDALSVGRFMRQPCFYEPIEYAVERNAVDTQRSIGA